MVPVFEDSIAFKKRLSRTYPFCFLTYLRQHTMVFSNEGRAVTENDYEVKHRTVYRICKEHRSK